MLVAECSVAAFSNVFKHELDAILSTLLFRFSVAIDTPSPGNLLQNLRFRNEHHPSVRLASAHSGASRCAFAGSHCAPVIDADAFKLTRTQKSLYFFFVIFLRWLHARLMHMTLVNGWSAFPVVSQAVVLCDTTVTCTWRRAIRGVCFLTCYVLSKWAIDSHQSPTSLCSCAMEGLAGSLAMESCSVLCLGIAPW